MTETKVQLTYDVPVNINPFHYISVFGSICNNLGIVNNLPQGATLNDLPTELLGEDQVMVSKQVSDFINNVNIWSAYYVNLSCTGILLGNKLHLYFTLSGEQPENVVI